MSTTATTDTWSPADAPYAIAVSESQWYHWAIDLDIQRIRQGQDPQRQIDARHLLIDLQQLATAETLMQTALVDLRSQGIAIDDSTSQELADARQQFDTALPGLGLARHAITHFEDFARGLGRPQIKDIAAGVDRQAVVRDYWDFGYDPAAESVTLGKFTFILDVAGTEAHSLKFAIYMAAREVDAARARP